jgi:hypothetical protein
MSETEPTKEDTTSEWELLYEAVSWGSDDLSQENWKRIMDTFNSLRTRFERQEAALRRLANPPWASLSHYDYEDLSYVRGFERAKEIVVGVALSALTDTKEGT